MAETLLYVGCGNDTSFLNLDYDKYILIDTLPEIKHYEKDTRGYYFQENFFDEIKNTFGKCIHYPEKKLLHFYGSNIYYYYSTNYRDFEINEMTDIYIKGFSPDEKYILDRDIDKIYLHTDTYMPYNLNIYDLVSYNDESDFEYDTDDTDIE